MLLSDALGNMQVSKDDPAQQTSQVCGVLCAQGRTLVHTVPSSWWTGVSQVVFGSPQVTIQAGPGDWAVSFRRIPTGTLPQGWEGTGLPEVHKKHIVQRCEWI